MNTPHRIRRLRWNARTNRMSDAFALRRLLRERGDAVQAALDRALQGAAVADDEVIHLARLELRLSAASIDALALDFERGIELAASESVQWAIREARAGSRGEPAQPTTGARRGLALARRESLRHYLVHGLHDWTLAGIAPEEAALLLCQAAAEATEARDAVDAMLAAVTRAPERIGALLRWLRLLAPAQRQAWVARTVRRDAAAPAAAALAELRAALDGGAPHDELLQALWLVWPEAADEAAQRRWCRELAAWLPAWPIASQPVLHELLAALGPPTAEVPQPAATMATAETARPPAAAGTSLLVPMAGLVLLHPYLPRLLGGCGLVDPGARDFPPAALPRGCGLLHWLATGSDDAPEYDLPLIKLLLGTPPDQPLGLAPVLPAEAERDEALALLKTVPEHWRALRGTGIEGLRLSFLQRRGLLARADGGGWKLRVQAESFDLLLTTLPWSIGLVRLPWMAQALQVEWETP
jgi:hypothetical protein